MKNWILTPPSLEDFTRLLRAWRFWVFGALIGGLLGAAIYFVFPPEYRARATVVVDFNVEKSWPDSPDSEKFYYLERESRKLVDVAWSDATLQVVAAKLKMTVPALRSGKLELSQPQDGGWQFYATDPQADVAVKLASTWATAFVTQVRRGIQTEVALEIARKTLKDAPNDKEAQFSVEALAAKSLGITPEIQISIAQNKDLPITRKTGIGTYVLAGAVLVLVLGALWILFVSSRKDNA